MVVITPFTTSFPTFNSYNFVHIKRYSLLDNRLIQDAVSSLL